MNKKHLSVVMAGAMLATSVAPVLADTTSENYKEYTVNNSNRGILIKELRKLLTDKNNFFADVEGNNTTSGDYRGLGVYYVELKNTKNGSWDGIYTGDSTFMSATSLETRLKDMVNVPAGTTITVKSRGFQEVNGKKYAYAQSDVEGTQPVYDAKSLEKEFTDWRDDTSKVANYPAVYKMEYKAGVLTVTYRKAAEEDKLSTIEYKVGDPSRDFTKAVDKDGEVIGSDFSIINNFKLDAKVGGALKGANIDDVLLAKVTISDVDKAYNTVLSNVYDGLFLTANGQKLFETIKDYHDKMGKNVAGYNLSVPSSINSSANGVYSITIEFTKGVPGGKTVKQTVTISSNNKDQLELYRSWMYNVKVPVQILAGSNRYETAVKVAKENASISDVAENGNIVLVNGNALVDGLAAAPLASSVGNYNQTEGLGHRQAPILLTDTNGIPKETKAYIKELIGEQKIKNLDKVTVYLVGGEAVISPAVEKDLKDLGLRVVRAGGKDREATSLEVAKLMEKDTLAGYNGLKIEDTFVVGADGEADAMSVASVASATKSPIIVESRHGLSNAAIEYLEGYKNNSAKSATIIGGETVVAKETEKKLIDAKVKVERVAGENRQETNAKVINTYYGVNAKTLNGIYPAANPGHKFDNVLVSKDGQRNKSELIDALTATSLAVKHNAPIVLGTNKLSNDQINVLELNANRAGVYVYQVGNGVARDVVKTIAERIGLAK